jgi:hypothetical protein
MIPPNIKVAMSRRLLYNMVDRPGAGRSPELDDSRSIYK